MKKLILIAASAFVTVTVNAQSATSSATQVVNLNLSNAIDITFVGSGTATGGSVDLAFNDINDYATGIQSTAQALKVRSNKNFKVDVKANSANFTYTGTTTPAPIMPVSGILGLKVSANGTGGTIATPFTATAFSNLSATSASLISNGTYGGNQTFSVMYEAKPGFTFPAGTYSTQVVYTATQL